MSRPHDFQHFMPTKVIFGRNALARVGEEATRLGSKALIVTGRSAMKKFGFTDKLDQSLTDKGLSFSIYDEAPSNPGLKSVADGVNRCIADGCDMVIALGGGSAIDVAKAIASSAGLGIPIKSLLENPVERPGLPFIAIPTTSGTGAEVTHISVLTIEETNHKIGFRTSYTFPTVAIVDPDLTVNLPKYVMAYTGMDALTHAIEAYTSKTSNIVSDSFALQAIGLVNESLRDAVNSPFDLEARSKMALASVLAGMAISQAGTGGAHGIGMTVGGICDTDHGITVAIALPAVIRFNLEVCTQKYVRVAELLGENTSGLSLIEAGERAAVAVEKLLADLELPVRLSALGVDDSLLDRLMEDTKRQRVWGNNARDVSWDDVEQLFRAVL